MDEDLIISIKEFRKLAGKEAARFSDEQIIELIIDFDFMATMFINKEKKGVKNEQPSGR